MRTCTRRTAPLAGARLDVLEDRLAERELVHGYTDARPSVTAASRWRRPKL